MAAFLLLAGGYLAGKRQGNQDAITGQLMQTVKAERERGKDDEKLRGLSDYDFCALALRRRGLPIDQCDELRGVPEGGHVSGWSGRTNKGGSSSSGTHRGQ